MSDNTSSNPVDPLLEMTPFEPHRYEPFASLEEFLDIVESKLGNNGLIRLHNAVASPENHPRTWKWEEALRARVYGTATLKGVNS